jgi:DUF2891 family protein
MSAPSDEHVTERFSNVGLACVHRGYPHNIAYVWNSDVAVLHPRWLTPAFYGCFAIGTYFEGSHWLGSFAVYFPSQTWHSQRFHIQLKGHCINQVSHLWCSFTTLAIRLLRTGTQAGNL